MPLVQQPKRKSMILNHSILPLDVRGSLLIVGLGNEILSLRADSLKIMADAVEFEQVDDNWMTMSLAISKDGKYYLFTLIMYLYINYDLYIIIKLKIITMKICCFGKLLQCSGDL